MINLTLTDEQADILYDAINEHFKMRALSEHYMSIDDDSIAQVLSSIKGALKVGA
jgi:hypothetical protein